MKKIRVVLIPLLMMFIVMGFSACCNKPDNGGVQPPVLSYTITATASAGGTISPLGVTTVLANATQDYQINATAGNYIKELKVNNEAIDLTPGMTTHTYTFSALKSNSTIHVEFASFAKISLTETQYKGGTLVSSSGPTVISKDILLNSTTKIVIPNTLHYNVDSITIIGHGDKKIIINIAEKDAPIKTGVDSIEYTYGIANNGERTENLFSINNDIINNNIIILIKDIKNDVQIEKNNQAMKYKFNYKFWHKVMGGGGQVINSLHYSEDSRENIAFYGDVLNLTFINGLANDGDPNFAGWYVYKVNKDGSMTSIAELASTVTEFTVTDNLLFVAKGS